MSTKSRRRHVRWGRILGGGLPKDHYVAAQCLAAHLDGRRARVAHHLTVPHLEGVEPHDRRPAPYHRATGCLSNHKPLVEQDRREGGRLFADNPAQLVRRCRLKLEWIVFCVLRRVTPGKGERDDEQIAEDPRRNERRRMGLKQLFRAQTARRRAEAATVINVKRKRGRDVAGARLSRAPG